MNKPLTIALLQAHGVSQLVVYCRGKRKGDWPCHHSAELPLHRFRADELLGDIEQAAVAQHVDGGGPIFGLITASRKHHGKVSAG